jgi:hypothetical protein
LFHLRKIVPDLFRHSARIGLHFVGNAACSTGLPAEHLNSSGDVPQRDPKISSQAFCRISQ